MLTRKITITTTRSVLLPGFLATLLLCLSACAPLSPASSRGANADPHTGIVLSDTASVFPLQHYDQNIDHWIDPARPDYDLSVLPSDVQAQALRRLTGHLYGYMPVDDAALIARADSPWNPAFIDRHTRGPDMALLSMRIRHKLDQFGAHAQKAGFGMNLRPLPEDWITPIADNIDLQAFSGLDGYRPAGRSITIRTTALRELPTSAPYYYDPRLPGEGYPFDNLSITALRAGTPVYVFARTRDNAWSYVMTPDESGWLDSAAIASADERFVTQWRAAMWQAPAVIVSRNISISDSNGIFRFRAPVGTLMPLLSQSGTSSTLLIAVAGAEQQAQLRSASVPNDAVSAMPLSASPAHFAMLIKALQGRPYSWGGDDNGNDCSLELKSLFAPMGIWLPRHSSEQVNGAGMIDLSSRSPQERITWLQTQGTPLRSIIDIKGHVMLYLGNGMVNGKTVPLVYEDLWGLSPADGSRRAILGQSFILPLLMHFPEDAGLRSQAASSRFRVRAVDGR